VGKIHEVHTLSGETVDVVGRAGKEKIRRQRTGNRVLEKPSATGSQMDTYDEAISLWGFYKAGASGFPRLERVTNINGNMFTDISKISDKKIEDVLRQNLANKRFADLPDLLVTPFTNAARFYNAPFEALDRITAKEGLWDPNEPTMVGYTLDTVKQDLLLNQGVDASAKYFADKCIHEFAHIG